MPLFCGSAELTYGTRALLSKMVELLPAPTEIPAPAEGPLIGHVFKIISEPHVGDVSLFRIYTGTIRNGDEVWNAEHNVAEKLNHLSVQQGKDRFEVPELAAGDIGSVAKLRDTHTNDTFCRRESALRLPPIPFPEALATSAVVVKMRGEEDKLAAGLHKLHEEDPTFHFEYSSELGQTLVHGMGERHFEILLGRLQRKFGVHAELARPRVAYRETLKGKGEGQGKHKKQSGGRGQYGDCWVRFSPPPRGSGYKFVDSIVGSHSQPLHPGGGSRDSGIGGAWRRGRLSDGGFPGRMLRRVVPRRRFQRNVVQDGGHPRLQEHRTEVPASAAGAAAGRHGLDPAEILGDVMGDLSSRRGQILGTDTEGRLTRIKAIVPEAELYKYATTLHSITHGRGTFHLEHHGYAEAPPEVSAKVASENKRDGKENGDE